MKQGVDMDEERKRFSEEYKLEDFGNTVAKCPKCGHLEQDSWELDDEGVFTCGNCESEFWYEKEVIVEFTTYAEKRSI
jgi:hypothetical protein